MMSVYPRVSADWQMTSPVKDDKFEGFKSCDTTLISLAKFWAWPMDHAEGPMDLCHGSWTPPICGCLTRRFVYLSVSRKKDTRVSAEKGRWKKTHEPVTYAWPIPSLQGGTKTGPKMGQCCHKPLGMVQMAHRCHVRSSFTQRCPLDQILPISKKYEFNLIRKLYPNKINNPYLLAHQQF